MLSLSCKAAIKATIYLGSKLHSTDKTGIKDIAEYIDENEHTVAKLLQKLVKKKIIKSAKGPNGGFYITPEQTNIKIIEIVKLIDGNDVFEHCGLGLNSCNDAHPCPFHNEFKPIRDDFKKMCSTNSIKNLYENVVSGFEFLNG